MQSVHWCWPSSRQGETERGRAKRKVSYAVLLPMMMDYLRKDEEKRRVKLHTL